MEATPEEGKAGRLLDPADVRVFFIPSKGSAGAVGKVDEDCLETPCGLLRVYQEWFEGEHLLKWSRNEDGSSTLAEAWERVRPRFVTEVDVKSGE